MKTARFLLAHGLALAATLSPADTLVFEQGVSGYAGTRDNTLYEGAATLDNTNGGHPYFYSGTTQFGDTRRALLAFDVSSLPVGATVASAQLRLTVDRSRPTDDLYSLHRLARDWGEGTLDSLSLSPPFFNDGGKGAPAATGDATWRSNHHGQSLWTTQGGDFVTTASASTIAPRIDGAEANFQSAGMSDDVQFWIDSPASNHGWILLGNEAGNWNSRRFDSSEGAAGKRPRLTVVFDPPPPNSASAWRSYR